MNGNKGYTLSRPDLTRVKGAVRFVETLSRETTNVTPETLPAGVIRQSAPQGGVTWPIKITGDPPGGSADLSILYLGTIYVRTTDATEDVWEELEVLVRPIDDDIEQLKVGMQTLGMLSGEYAEAGAYQGKYEFLAASSPFGCGFLYDDATGTWTVDVAGLAGTGLAVDSSGDCDKLTATGAAVTLGCGLASTGGDIHVDLTSNVFDGLYWNSLTCALGVDPGCGLAILADEKLGLDLTDVVFDGLYWNGETCALGIDYGCGLGLTGTQLVVDFTSVVSGGLTWDPDLCLLGIELECGLYYTGTGIAVNVDDIAGDRASTALVPVDNTDPVCDSIAVDLEVDSTTTETVVTNVVMSIVAGKLRTTLTKVTYTNHFNEAGLHIDRTAGSPVDTYSDLDICPIVECCLAEPLVAECTKSNSGGELVDGFWEVDFTAGASGGVATAPGCSGYTYSWDFDDGSAVSTAQNPTHEYEAAGTYHPVVTVTDCCGNTDTCEPGTITVTAPVVEPEMSCENAVAGGALALNTTYGATIADGDEHWWYFGSGSAEAICVASVGLDNAGAGNCYGNWMQGTSCEGIINNGNLTAAGCNCGFTFDAFPFLTLIRITNDSGGPRAYTFQLQTGIVGPCNPI